MYTCACAERKGKKKKHERTEAHLKMRQERKRGEKKNTMLSFIFFFLLPRSCTIALTATAVLLEMLCTFARKEKKSRESADICIEREGKVKREELEWPKTSEKTVQGHKKKKSHA